jgi:hypothetical protein
MKLLDKFLELNENMNELSFDIKDSIDFFKKLTEDHADFLKDKTSSRIALNCAMTAWHLTEWVYNEFITQLSIQFTSLVEFQNEMKKNCQSLQIMHDLTNGSKHYVLKRHIPIIKDTALHRGSYDRSYSRAYDVSNLYIQLKDGSRIFFEDEIATIVKFWEMFLTNSLSLDLKGKT